MSKESTLLAILASLQKLTLLKHNSEILSEISTLRSLLATLKQSNSNLFISKSILSCIDDKIAPNTLLHQEMETLNKEISQNQSREYLIELLK
jgi:hypothetical protein